MTVMLQYPPVYSAAFHVLYTIVMRRSAPLRLALCLLTAVCSSVPPPAFSAQVNDNRVTLNFVDTDIPAVLRALSLFTKKNFLVDPRVKGTMTLVSERPVDRETALDMLTGSLRMQGLAMVDVGGVTRVVPEADGKLQGSRVATGERVRATVPDIGGGYRVAEGAAGRGASGSSSTAPRASSNRAPISVAEFDRGGRGSEMLTRVFPLKYENAANLVPVLRPMVPPNNPVNAYPGNNTIVVTDYADNLERIAQVIARIDVPTSMDTDVVPVRNGIASDIAMMASQLLDAQGGDATQRLGIVADPRTNSVIIRSGSPARTQLARDLVRKLDTDNQRPGNLHVVYLRNAQAVRLAEVLGGLLTGQSGQSASASGNGGSGSQGSRFGGGGSQGGSRSGAASGRGSSGGLSGMGGSSSSSGAASGASTTNAIDRGDGNAMQPVSFSAGGATVQADPTTNTLIISAPEPLYRSLREVIDALDQRRAQVLVESLIVEVTDQQAAEFGIQWMGATNGLGANGRSVIGGVNAGGTSLNPNGATSIDVLPRGLNVGLVSGTIDIPGVGAILDLNILARALNTTGSANILSTPNLLTLDNEAASILVGKTVPFVTGQYVTSGSDSSSNPFQTIEREDIGLKLNIRPQISEGGAVKLDIYQEVSSIDQAQSTISSGLVTNKRAIDTSVLIDDGQIIVLGGLLEDSVSNTQDSVPLLGSIPLLGALFRYDSRQRTKTNLMVFLRPHVLRDAQAGASVTLDRYDYMRRAQSAAQPGNHWLLPDMQAPILPPANVRAVGQRGGAHDLRPEAAAQTLLQPAPETTQSFAVRHLPQRPEDSMRDQPIRANVPLGVSIATDPAALYGSRDTANTTLQIAAVSTEADANAVAQRVRMSGLTPSVQPGPGNQGYVVRTYVSRDSTTVDTTLNVLRQLGYRPELVTHL